MLKMFVFIDIWFVKQDIQKWLRYAVYYGEFKNKQKKDNFFLTFQSGDSNSRFSVFFPPMVWIFMEGEGDEIKPTQASKVRSF